MHYERDKNLRAKGYYPEHTDATKASYYNVEMNRPRMHKASNKSICCIEDCNEMAKSRGMCKKHYARWYYGEMRRAYKQVIASTYLPGAPEPDISIPAPLKLKETARPGQKTLQWWKDRLKTLGLEVDDDITQRAYMNGAFDNEDDSDAEEIEKYILKMYT